MTHISRRQLDELGPDSFNFSSANDSPFGLPPRLFDPLSLIGGVGSLIGGVIGGDSAAQAAKQKAAADQAAATGIQQATSGAEAAGYAGITEANSALNAGTAVANQDISAAGQQQQQIYNTETGGLQPYQQAGQQGLTSLANMAGTFQAPTAAQAAATPGYQFQLQQGEKAVQNSAAGSGLLQSGATLKALDQYSQGLASTNYQNAYNNSLTAFNTNQQGYQTLANLGTNANSQAISAGSTYGGQLTSLANLGANTNLQSAGQLANVAQSGNQYVGSAGLQGATSAGNALEGVGSAQAAGTIGVANAASGALQGVGNAAIGAGIMGNLSNMGTVPQNYGVIQDGTTGATWTNANGTVGSSGSPGGGDDDGWG